MTESRTDKTIRLRSATDSATASPCPVFSIEDDAGLGWKRLGLGIRTDVGEAWISEPKVTEDKAGLRIDGRYPDHGLRETVTVERAGGDGAILRRTVTNERPNPAVLLGAFLGCPDAESGPTLPGTPPMDVRFAHPDNVRVERFPWCRMEFPYVRPVPRTPTWFGEQESQPVPALLITDDTGKQGLLSGQLDQRFSRMRFLLCAHPRSLFGEWRIDWDVHTGGKVLQAGETLEWEPAYFQILRDIPWERGLDRYLEVLGERQDFSLQARNPLLDKAFYCSWNYGIGRNFTQESLLKTAGAIREHFPSIRYFMIDGGWQSHERLDAPDCSNFYRPDGVFHKADILPEGMDGLARHLRELGLKPAIWWTPSVDMSSTLARQHPEWLAKDANGAPHRIMKSGFLDYSLPEVQAYLRSCFDIIFNRWGYEAIKMDFWSQSAESDHIRFRSGTGIEWRDWLLSTIQGYLPKDGFLMNCVATGMGNPFVTRLAQTYRCCIDIGAYRTWRSHMHASSWVQPLLAIPGRRFGLMNVDGLGVSEHVSDDENLHRLTYGFITMGSLEIDGRLETLSPNHRDWLQRVTAHVDRGYRVHCPELHPYTGEPYPTVLYVDYPPGSPTFNRGVRKHVALLNWENKPAVVGVMADDVGLREGMRKRNFWTDQEETFSGPSLAELLPPHGARLYEFRDA